MIGDVKKRISSIGINIEFDDSVLDLVAKEGFDPVYGARPLRRAVVRLVEDSVSEAMLSGSIKEGDNVEATVVDGKISYKVKENKTS